MRNTAESAEEVDGGLGAMPYLIRSLAIDALRGSSVQDEHGRGDHLPQNQFGSAFAFNMLLAIPITV